VVYKLAQDEEPHQARTSFLSKKRAQPKSQQRLQRNEEKE